MQFCETIQIYVLFHRKLLNFGTPQFWEGPPILADWGSQGP